MLDTVWRYCEKENLIAQEDTLLVGVSGGADSVCLLLVLKALQKKCGFALEAVHVEHGIRGKESMADAAFVENLCGELEVPLHTYSVQALAYAKEKKIGLEEAARELRYECYRKAAGEVLAKVKIALAHHGDDNAETMLFQMMRGSGLDGLAGMQPKRALGEHLEVIRPLLCVTRAEIEAYLLQVGQDYCVDSTNTDETYSRNRIRQSILPALTEVNAQAVAHMNQSAELLREVNDYLMEQVAMHAKEVLQEREEGILIWKEPYEALPRVLQKELLHLALVRAAGVAKDIGMTHVLLLEELFTLQVGRSLDLPYGLLAKRVYEGVLLNKCETEPEQEIFFEIEREVLEAQRACEVETPLGTLSFRILENSGKTPQILKNTYTKWLDYDKIERSFQIRTRRSGDYLIIDDLGHKKSLKEYFVNEKVPSAMREKTLLLATASKVLWVIGHRISADVKISDGTSRILEIRMTGGRTNED